MKRSKALWLRVQAFGGSVSVYVVPWPLIMGDTEEVVAAYFDFRKPEILVARQNVDAMKHALWHELGHLALKEDQSIDAETEENVMRALDHVHYDMLVRAGMVRIPNPPKSK